MIYNTSEYYNCVLFEFRGNLMGGPDTARLNDDLHALIDKGKKEVVVDLSNVKFMNSAGLGILIGGLTTMRNAGGDLRIAGADQRIKSLLIITRLITVFESYRTRDEAVQSFKKKSKA